MSKTKLFSPGPVMVRNDVRETLLHYDICHRSPEFEEMFIDTQEKIKYLFQADNSYYALLISGSGTAANETVLSSIFKPGEAALLIRNGAFGERLQEILDQYAIPYVDCAFEWGQHPDTEAIRQALAAYPEVTFAAMVYHETSTGMINPVGEVGALCTQLGKRLFVDCVSAAGGELISVADKNISIATSVGGKCVGAYPGSAYVCAKEDILKSLTAAQCRNVYLSLYKHYQNAVTTHQTPNTPNVNLFWPLNKALSNIAQEGIERRVEGRQRCANILREGVKQLGLKILLEEHRSNTVTSVFLPSGVDLSAFIAAMEARGYTLYKGKGKFEAMGMFQIANMGEIYEADCFEFLDALKACLAALQA
ncbi:MAG: aminotransferase class V-fold PLP-dependent enzyme [Christensenellaceae bacterium]|jgi:2-aminoethylphosphonate-pyruvate transaminase|nr:aminotransferase class V-fold PLP-dependent enzyme [Christensenellaceae bacterium]